MSLFSLVKLIRLVGGPLNKLRKKTSNNSSYVHEHVQVTLTHPVEPRV